MTRRRVGEEDGVREAESKEKGVEMDEEDVTTASKEAEAEHTKEVEA